MKNKIVKKRTLNELRQVKTYGYRTPSPTKEKRVEKKEHVHTNKNETIDIEPEQK